MSMIDELTNIIGICNSEILHFKKINSNNIANSYLLFTKKDKFFIKRYKDRKNIDHNVIKLDFMREINSIKKLNTIKVDTILTPKLITYDQNKTLYVIKYIEGYSIKHYIIKTYNRFNNINNENLERLFYQLGIFFAKLHNKYFINYENNEPISFLHGDLNNKNIIFTKNNELFIFDPGRIEDRIIGSIYQDLSRIMLNFYIPFFFLNFILDGIKIEGLGIQFLEGYTKNSVLKLDLKKLKKHMFELLRQYKQSYFKNGKFLDMKTLALSFMSIILLYYFNTKEMRFVK